ncbi:RidA family protein [Gemmatimonas sp.]|uniref:RidA family protein n=1 Tax=Gemmatimonas sp. TaxID=1962908 RepID=UPI00286D93AA|nr:RidA family protein [Gemmatimonas sp.]
MAIRHITSLALMAVVPFASACRKSVRTSAEPQFIHPDGPPANPFSPAVRVGNILFVSGTLGTKPDGTLVPGGIQPETRQLLENVKRTLAAAGVGMDRVVKCTVFLADLKEWPAMNEVYRSYFSNGNYPARTAVQATLLFGARVEMECAAAAK